MIQTFTRSDVVFLGGDSYLVKGLSVTGNPYNRSFVIGGQKLYGPDTPEAIEQARQQAEAAPVDKYADGFATTTEINETLALCAGPIYRIAPNGGQDIQIDDNSIDSLLNLDTDGSINTDLFYMDGRTGLYDQSPMPYVGEYAQSPRYFRSPVSLKFGNLVSKSSVTPHETSPQAWDRIRFNFTVQALYNQSESGDYSNHTITLKIKVYNRLGTLVIADVVRTITNQNISPVSVSVMVTIPENHRSPDGYKFTIEKISPEIDSNYTKDEIYATGWDEIETSAFSYPGVALAGYILLSSGKYQGSAPTISTNVKGRLVRVPTNYNQPTTRRPDGSFEIDWRHLETNIAEREVRGIYNEKDGDLLTPAGGLSSHPYIYDGNWNGKDFKYSWSQNPAWIIAEIMTNEDYGLSIEDSMIDWFSFYAASVYYDDCDISTGRFLASIETQADGSYRHKPVNRYTSVREELIGSPSGTMVNTRRSTLNFTINQVISGADLINKLGASCRSRVVYSGGKYRLKVDRPDETPVLIVNDTNIKENSIAITGKSEGDIITGVEASYIEPMENFKRKVISIDSTERYSGINQLNYENKQRLEFTGITNKGEATRLAQYHIAASKYIREDIELTLGPEAIDLTIGDVFGISTNDSGLSYGHGGKVLSTNYVNSTKSNVALNYYAYPPIDSGLFTQNSAPLSMVVTSNVGEIKRYTLTSEYTLDTANNIVNVQTNENIYSTPPGNVVYEDWGSEQTATVNASGSSGRYTTLNANSVDDIPNTITGNPILLYFVGSQTYYIVYNYLDNGTLTQVWAAGSSGDNIFLRTRTNNTWSGFTTTSGESITNLDLSLNQLDHPRVFKTNVSVANSPFTEQVNAVVHRNYDSNGVAQNSMSVIFLPSSSVNNFVFYERDFTPESTPAADPAILPYYDWNLGETNKTYKEYKVLSITKKIDTPEFDIVAEEYIPEVYRDSEEFIDVSQTTFVRRVSNYLAPPVPTITVEPRELEFNSDVFLELVVEAETDTKYYPNEFTTDIYTADAYQTRRINSVIQNTSNLILETSNVDHISNTCIITGKNGFSARAGRIPYLCTSVSVEDDPNNSLGVIKFEIQDNSFGQARDPNTRELIGQVGDDLIIPVEEKIGTTNFEINRRSTISDFDETIKKVNGNVWIDNKSTKRGLLSTIIPSTPFYVYAQQDVSNVSANNKIHVSGYREIERLEGTVPLGGVLGGAILSNLVVDLQTTPRDKRFVSLEIDGKLKTQNEFILDRANLIYTPSETEVNYKITVEHYHPPVYEIGDSVALATGEDFKIANTSYLGNTADSTLTNQKVFWVKLDRTPTHSLQDKDLINVSKDFVGTIGSNTSSNLTFNYSAANNGEYTLPNVYKLQDATAFSLLNTPNSTVPDVKKGVKIIRARNRNSIQKLSPYVTQTIDVDSLLLDEAKDVELIESVERGKTDAYVEYAVVITPSDDIRITHYIVEYRLEGIEDLTNNNQRVEWIQQDVVDIASIGDDGKLRTIISNINYGAGPRDSKIYVRVTPTNKRNKGVVTYRENVIIGKTATPFNVINFRGAQKGSTINFDWEYQKQNNKLVDQDLRSVIIRRIPGDVPISLLNYNSATPFVIAAASNDFAVRPILSWGTYTYLVRTEDTSGNLSETVVGQVITTAIQESSRLIRRYNEDNPGTDDFNNGEGRWPSFYLSNTGGLPGPGATFVDNANGSSLSFSAGIGNQSIQAIGNSATYITQIRDLGREMRSDLNITAHIEQSPTDTFNDQYEIIETGVSLASSGDLFTFSNWGAPQNVTTPPRIDADILTTDGIYPFRSGSTNVNGYFFDGYIAVWTEGDVQLQMLIGGLVNEPETQRMRGRLLPSGSYTDWVPIPSNRTTNDANTISTTPLYIPLNNSSTNLPSFDFENHAGLLVFSDENQTIYRARFRRQTWTRTYSLRGGSDVVAQASNVLVDTNIVGSKGIGDYLREQPNLRYSERNKTLISGEEGDRVWAIRNPGQHADDNSNVGSYALISEVVTGDSIRFGEAYYANGYSTGSNNLPNTSISSSYQLIDLKQFSDLAETDNYQGDPGGIETKVYYRYATTYPYYSNNNVNIRAFADYQENDGWKEYISGVRNQRYFQLRFDYKTERPQDFSVHLQRFRYDVIKEKVSQQYNLTYTGSNTELDFSAARFVYTPVTSVNILTDVGGADVRPIIQGLSNTTLGIHFVYSNNSSVYTETLEVLVGLSGA